MKTKKNSILQIILWIVQGCIVGIGAILPGVSGGTLCYAFGIYNPILEVLSNPIKGLKKNWFMLIFVILGVGLGFVGFAGVTEWLLGLNEAVVLCVFIGLIAGTIPDIWKEAGEHGRSKFSVISLILSFVAITIVFYVLKDAGIVLQPGFVSWLLCGLLWGLSFIVPGFSSSTLILFFGLYEEMSRGISHLDPSVIIPLGLAIAATFLLLSKAMKFVLDKFHSVVSHCVLGFVAATTLMLFPINSLTENPDKIVVNLIIYAVCIVCGAVASFFFSVACNNIKASVAEKEEQ